MLVRNKEDNGWKDSGKQEIAVQMLVIMVNFITIWSCWILVCISAQFISELKNKLKSLPSGVRGEETSVVNLCIMHRI